jgi:hypothetical protein
MAADAIITLAVTLLSTFLQMNAEHKLRASPEFQNCFMTRIERYGASLTEDKVKMVDRICTTLSHSQAITKDIKLQ